MKVQRTIPPTAAPLRSTDLVYGTAGFFFGKKYLRELEKGLKQYFGVRHLFLVSSGKAALTVILKALSTLSPEKKKVLMPAYTCFSVPSAVVKAGLAVAACDLNSAEFDFDYKLLNKELHEEVLCVISTHLFGIPADTDRVNSICKPRGIFVIEDAAQAMGGSRNRKKLGTIGDVGFFSLGRGKNITCGSGGIIITNDKIIAKAIGRLYKELKLPGIIEDIKELIKLFGMKVFMHPNLYWIPAAMPSLKLGETVFYREFPVRRMSGMQAGVLRKWRERLMKNNRIRQGAGAFYRKAVCGPSRERRDHIPYLRYPVLLRDRETRDFVFLSSKALGISMMYPAPVNEIPEIKESFFGQSFPAAKDISERLIALPTHGLSDRKAKMLSAARLTDRLPDRRTSVLISEGQGA